MFGSRLKILTDGAEMLGACPSRMDAPTSYIAPEDFDLLSLIKGPETVLWGPGNSAGTETRGAHAGIAAEEIESLQARITELRGEIRSAKLPATIKTLLLKQLFQIQEASLATEFPLCLGMSQMS